MKRIQLIGGFSHGVIFDVPNLLYIFEVPVLPAMSVGQWIGPDTPLRMDIKTVKYRLRDGQSEPRNIYYYDHVDQDVHDRIHVFDHSWSVTSPPRGHHLRPGSMVFRQHPPETLLCKDHVSRRVFVGHLWAIDPGAWGGNLLCRRCGTIRDSYSVLSPAKRSHPECEEAERRRIVALGWSLINANQKETT